MTANSNPNAKSNTNTSVFINHPLRDIQRRYKRMCSLINTLKIMLGWLRRYYPRSCIYFYNYNNVYVLLNIFFSFVVWTFDSISGGIWKLKKFEREFFSYAFFVFFFIRNIGVSLTAGQKQTKKAKLCCFLSSVMATIAKPRTICVSSSGQSNQCTLYHWKLGYYFKCSYLFPL